MFYIICVTLLAKSMITMSCPLNTLCIQGPFGCKEAVHARAEKMLPSSSTTPAAAALVISQALAAIKLPARSPQNVESQDISGEESNTVEEAGDRDKQY